jgi:hypothetical protein
MFQMSFSASRATRLLVAVGVAWLGLALSAQAAHATYGKVQIVKVNQGGDQGDTFNFHPTLTPAAGDFSLKGGQTSATYSVECNVDRPGHGTECTSRWQNVTLKFAELAKPGYKLTDITCRFTQGSSGYALEPTTSSALKPASEVTTDLANGTVSLKVHYYERVKCWFTNTRDSTIKVTKALAPATDSGKFNLLVDGQVKATNIGDGGTTGVQTVAPGTHTVGESAGTATDLANYDSTTSCVDKAHAAKPADTDGSVQVAAGDQWECVITNTRKSTPPPPPTPPTPPTTPPSDVPPVQSVSPRIAVSPARVRPGSARLSGPSGCPTTSAVAASVSGRRIVKVTFYVDGRKVKTLTEANRNGKWVLPMNVKRFAFGTHRVRVTVQFARSSQTKARTLRLSFNRCRPAVVKPQFTG